MRLIIGRSGWITALIAMVLALSPAVGFAQQQQGIISGTVTDRLTNAPIPSVRVGVPNTNRSALTNQQGHYILQGVPVGTYSVQASIIGYGSATNTASVTAGQTETVDFVLRAAAVS